jgi:hypothetical protein
VACYNNYPFQRLWRLDPDGHAISTQWPCRKVAIDEAGNTYAAYSDLRKFDADLNPIWTQWLWNTYLNEMEVDREGSVFLAGEGDWGGYLVKLRQVATLVIRDAHGDTIPNVEFELIRVHNDRPRYTGDTLGYFTTDSLGQFKLPMVRCDSLLFPVGSGNDKPDTLAIGDTIRVAKHLASQPSFKNPNVSSYSVHLDNARFDKEGALLLDTVALDIFDITLGHTEVRFNLSVTTEWRATFGYMAELQDNIRLMSNYLYDVSDGQIRLDTVTTYAAGNWALSDVRIFASNVLRPNADVNGMFGPDLRRYVNFPRKFIPGRSDRRNLSDVTPLLLTDVSDDYRAKAHELGHYALGFYDEYEFLTDTGFVADDALRCFAFPLSNYGFMDSQYESDGEKSSEMSSAYRYELAPCQNTEQWGLNGMSCWDQFEDSYEGIWGADHIYAPILVPKVDDEEEHDSLTATYIFPGPNDDINNLDYDVGRLVVFPLSPQTQQLDYKNVHVAVEGIFNPAEVIVELVNKPLQPYEKKIDQGETSDAGRIWVLGAYEPSYSIHASRGRVDELFARTASFESVTEKWLYAVAEPGAGLDSVALTMQEVAGDYPLICQATLQADQLVYELVVERPFSSVPSLRLYPGYDSSFNYDLVAGTGGYSVAITDSLGSLGSIDTWAVDDSASQFFFPTYFTTADIKYSDAIIEILGPENESWFVIDTSNNGIERAMVLSSPYPVMRTGLEPGAVQAGRTHCLSLFPNQELHSSNLVIGYADGDLMVGELKKGDESTLEMYRWMGGAQGWVPVGGSIVDTVGNQVWSPLPSPGTYAAFTTNIVTDVDDDEHGVILPYQFELSQNYPNPFNPITTIEYSLPRRSSVRVDIFNLLGQKVRTFVNREQTAGSYTITWDGTSANGQSVATGVYLYRFQAGDHVETKKMLLLK